MVKIFATRKPQFLPRNRVAAATRLDSGKIYTFSLLFLYFLLLFYFQQCPSRMLDTEQYSTAVFPILPHPLVQDGA